MSVENSPSAAQSTSNPATATTRSANSTITSTTVSTATSVSSTTTPSLTPSKLQPAPAPLVSAWGKKSSTPQSDASTTTPASKSSQNGTQREQWPSAKAALESAATARETSLPSSIQTSPSASKSATISGSKVKTGKEKWVPFEANIVLPSASGSNKKKNNNRKKQGQGKTQQQQQQGKGGKDGKFKKTNGGDSKAQGSKSTAASDKKVESVTKGVEDLKVGSKVSQKENGNKEPSVPLDPLENKSSNTTTQQSTTKASTQQSNEHNHVSSEPLDQSSSTKQNVQNEGSSSPYQPQPAQNQNYQHNPQSNFRKRYSHRNSEPSNNYNQSYQQGGYNNHKGGNRRYNQGQRGNFNSYRHSIAGSHYNNASPYLLNPNGINYGYLPVVQPPLNYANNFYPNPNSRSNSGSPAANDNLAQLNGVNAAPIDLINNYYSPPIVYQPYETLTIISNQVSFYFSIENLVKDIFLRKQMNSKGFVPLKKLISFNRLKSLTGGDIQLLKNAILQLPHLELVNDKVRTTDKWENWVLPFENRDEAGQDEDEQTTTTNSEA
ncbi:La-related protein 1 [Wickerhamomyces ciferrii]|uniref:La-related protein 1 n=1 Tax=Wickerhamomyces ciferrii (strain ATCC 14091 / BCRC 22168 / CBS 111 / JCM 3599 / NBRC 0793 / NRRL Y-1031 F-60-10) TaxID=1206466 RepID=K0KHB8_WICCF|nr:La-related protein 1 [Wickerhamomyces ciferrii]CCH40563.1 La-related protein 1 [Wickerhamomyces ciferrii]